MVIYNLADNTFHNSQLQNNVQTEGSRWKGNGWCAVFLVIDKEAICVQKPAVIKFFRRKTMRWTNKSDSFISDFHQHWPKPFPDRCWMREACCVTKHYLSCNLAINRSFSSVSDLTPSNWINLSIKNVKEQFSSCFSADRSNSKDRKRFVFVIRRSCTHYA